MKHVILFLTVFFLIEVVQLHASGDKDNSPSQQIYRDSNGSPFYFYIKPRSLSNASITSDFPSSRSVSSETINLALVFLCCKGMNSSRCSVCRDKLSYSVQRLCNQIFSELQIALDRGQGATNRYENTTKFHEELQNQKNNLNNNKHFDDVINKIHTNFNNYNYCFQSITESTEFKDLQKLSDQHLSRIQFSEKK